MLYTVHGYYGKYASRKQHSKIEALVYAANREKAEKLVIDLFDGYPAIFEGFSVVGGIKIESFDDRPELIGVDPNQGYIYNEIYHCNTIRKYFG